MICEGMNTCSEVYITARHYKYKPEAFGRNMLLTNKKKNAIKLILNKGYVGRTAILRYESVQGKKDTMLLAPFPQRFQLDVEKDKYYNELTTSGEEIFLASAPIGNEQNYKNKLFSTYFLYITNIYTFLQWK